MALDFEALRDATTRPAPSKGEVLKTRLSTLHRLVELGIPDETIASSCDVLPYAVQRWKKEDRVPRGRTAKIALDRLNVIIGHMEDDLGLTDTAISTFLTEEPHVLPERQNDGIHGRWDPERYAWEQSPIMTNVSAYSGLAGIAMGPEAFQERLRLRFPERHVEAEAGIVATPETVV